MKVRIEILNVIENSGVSKKDGRPYTICTAHCIVNRPEGDRIVGQITLGEKFKQSTPGTYEATFGVGVDMSGKISVQITDLQQKAVIQPKVAA